MNRISSIHRRTPPVGSLAGTESARERDFCNVVREQAGDVVFLGSYHHFIGLDNFQIVRHPIPIAVFRLFQRALRKVLIPLCNLHGRFGCLSIQPGHAQVVRNAALKVTVFGFALRPLSLGVAHVGANSSAREERNGNTGAHRIDLVVIAGIDAARTVACNQRRGRQTLVARGCDALLSGRD